jgi:class 3 adenylate cyclase
MRAVLPALRVPTLILHRAGDPLIRPDHGRFLAEHIPDARYVELEGEDHMFFVGDTARMLDEIEVFLTGAAAGAEPDRLLASVLFTDIVGSTDTAAALGDRRWRELLDRHDTLTREHVTRFRGRVVKTTGDGALATFDGPARAIRCALELRDAVSRTGVELRAGIHTGEVEQRDDDIGGIAVHLAARVQALAGEREVLVSRTVADLVAGSGIAFSDRGEHELKGVPGRWRLLAVEDS